MGKAGAASMGLADSTDSPKASFQEAGGTLPCPAWLRVALMHPSHCTELTGSRDSLPFSLPCFDWFSTPSSLAKVPSSTPPSLWIPGNKNVCVC